MKYIFKTTSIVLVTLYLVYAYMPLSWINRISPQNLNLGATQTTIVTGDTVKSALLTITNDNFTNINTELATIVGTTTNTTITSLANLVTVGTIGTGVWQGTAITDANVNDALTISSSGSVDKGALQNSGTLSFDWADSEVADTLTIDSASVITAPNFVADIGTATSTFAGGLTVQSSFLVVEDGSGRIGIGTSTPSYLLDLYGDFRIDNGEVVFVVQPLTDGATITIDWSTGNKFYVTLGGNRTLAFSNISVGQAITVYVSQDGTGSRTLTQPASVTGPSLTLGTNAGITDILVYSTATSTATVHGRFSAGD